MGAPSVTDRETSALCSGLVFTMDVGTTLCPLNRRTTITSQLSLDSLCLIQNEGSQLVLFPLY